jgi:molybdopterin-guanine dinucleotide biosynthesis protein A
MRQRNVSWVILAGGRATRMGGQDKGLLPFGCVTLIDHVYQQLARQTDTIYINANRNVDRYSTLAPVIQDCYADFQGPLAGMHASLVQLTDEWLGFIPCDGPMLCGDLIHRFESAINDTDHIYVAHDGKHLQPVYALLHRSILPYIQSFLDKGEKKVGFFYQQHRIRLIDFSDCPELFTNVNTPQQLSAAEIALRDANNE